ncbi:MAG: hypothetical protein LAO03_06025 [Acidobacteriia bacterium]|nr:hypothetical protein [Terriglobia bacterium]
MKLPWLETLLAVLLSTASLVHGQQIPFSLQTAEQPSEMPKALGALLDPQGIRLMTTDNGLTKIACEVWFSKTVAGKPGAGNAGLQYTNLSVGALVGVLRFTEEGEDSRDQKLKPGLYTLRYARVGTDPGTGQPADGVVLSPVSADTHVEQAVPLEELTRISRLASRTKNPAVMTLVPFNAAYKQFPAIVADDQGNCILQIKLQVQAAGSPTIEPLPVAILLITPEREDGES